MCCYVEGLPLEGLAYLSGGCSAGVATVAFLAYAKLPIQGVVGAVPAKNVLCHNRSKLMSWSVPLNKA